MKRLPHSSLYLVLAMLGACGGQTDGQLGGSDDGANRGGSTSSPGGQGAKPGHAPDSTPAIWRGAGGGWAVGGAGGTGWSDGGVGGSGWVGGAGGDFQGGSCGAESLDDLFGNTGSTGGSAGNGATGGAAGDGATGGTGHGNGATGGSYGAGGSAPPGTGGSAQTKGWGSGGGEGYSPEDLVRITWGNTARTCSQSWLDGCGDANGELSVDRNSLHPGLVIDLEYANAFMSASGVNSGGEGPNDCWFGGGSILGRLEILAVTPDTLRFRVTGTDFEEPNLDGVFTAYWCN